jgi:hypothetical protein
VILRGLPFADYLAAVHLRAGQINDFIDCGPDYFHRRHVLHTVEEKDKTAYIIGRAVHCLRLEGPEVYAKRHETIDLASRRSKAWDQFEMDCKDVGIEPLTIAEDQTIREIAAAIGYSQEALQLFAKGEGETTVRRDNTRYGMPLQVRPDWLNKDGCELSNGRPYYVSLKTTASVDTLHLDIASFGYYRCEAYYRWMLASEWGLPLDGVDVFMVAVEKSEPFRTVVYRFESADLDAGFLEVDAALRQIGQMKGMALMKWPRNKSGVQTWRMPDYIRGRSMATLADTAGPG